MWDNLNYTDYEQSILSNTETGALMQRELDTLQLEQFALFEGLEAATIEGLEQIARVHRLRAGEWLYFQGDMAHSFYAIQRGGVRLVENTTEGRAVNIKVYGQGEIFGLLAITGLFPHPAGVEAIDNSEIVGFRGDEFRLMMECCGKLSMRIIDMLVNHVHDSHARIREMAAERVERRLARALLHFGAKFGTSIPGGLEIGIGLSQQDIAEFTGTTVETVNRTLRQWEVRGYIRRARRQIDLIDIEALTDLADVSGMDGRSYLVS